MNQKDDRTIEEKYTARMVNEIYERKASGQSWKFIAEWLKTVTIGDSRYGELK